MYHHGYRQHNFFREWIRQTRDSVRIYLILGKSDNHLGLLEAMEEEGLFREDRGQDEEYFVVGIRTEKFWDQKSEEALITYCQIENVIVYRSRQVFARVLGQRRRPAFT